MMLLLALVSAASAQVPTRGDVAVTSIGAQGVRAEALEATTAGLMLGERLRWEIASDWRVVADARLNVYPDDPDTPLDQSRVRTLGVTWEDPGVWMALGRHSVAHGGPRIVDGVQVLGRMGPWELGAWGGLAPDLFTTAPALRPGGGPILAWQQGRASWSVVGEVVGAEGGLDRAAVLAQARASFAPVLHLSGRLDAQLVDGAPALADGAVFVRLHPGDVFRLDTFYDAFSSLRYLQTQALDPAVQRFAERADAAGALTLVDEELIDPRLNHLVGTTARVRTPGQVGLRVEGRARVRHHEDPLNRYARVGPAVALVGLADDRLEVIADGYATWRDTGLGTEAGLITFVEVGRDRALAVDTSGRVLFNPAYGGEPGWYADGFVDWLAPGMVTMSAGLSWTYEPDPLLDDVGIGAFLRLQQTFRPRRGEPQPVL